MASKFNRFIVMDLRDDLKACTTNHLRNKNSELIDNKNKLLNTC